VEIFPFVEENIPFVPPMGTACIFYEKVARPGFEPRHSEPKSDVLPLYYRAKQNLLVDKRAAKVSVTTSSSKLISRDFVQCC
jgi:hypothetical protein